VIPTAQQAEVRLQQILRRGSVNLGHDPDIERLMLMLTRSCELRCGYCFVQKREDAPTLSLDDAKRGLDLLMGSTRRRLEVQFFGGEPTREWDVLVGAIEHVVHHPARDGRKLDFIVTTNGLGLDPSRIEALSHYPVTLLLSLDGDAAAHRRYRAAHLCSDDAAYTAITQALGRLRDGSVPWFMNAVLPPAAADEVLARYRWAQSQGVTRLQLNYAVGMRWSQAQMDAYIGGLLDVLRAHHAEDTDMVLFNWRSDCEPVMLSDDLIVDVDGAVLHDGAIFLERRFAELARTYRRGHLDDLTAFDPLRWSLAELYDVMVGTYPPGSEERAIIEENCRFGAAVDLAIQALRKDLGLR
jgi:pyruvate-formate lyase-activating enzyme